MIATFSRWCPLWFCLVLSGCFSDAEKKPDRSRLPKLDIQTQDTLSQQRFNELIEAFDFNDFSVTEHQVLASYGISEIAERLETAYQQALNHLQQQDGDQARLAQAWAGLQAAHRDFLKALYAAGGNTLRFAINPDTGLVQEAPIFSDWMLHQQLTDPTALFKVTKKTSFNLKNAEAESLGLPTLARVSVNNPLDIPLNEPLDSRSLHLDGPDQNIFLLSLSLDNTEKSCEAFGHLASNPKADPQWPPLARADAFDATGNPVLGCYRIRNKTPTVRLFSNIRADLIQYTHPVTQQTTPVLRISPLKPLAENTRYLLVLGEGIRTAKQKKVKLPIGYFQLLSHRGTDHSQARNYAHKLYALAKESIETITRQDPLNPVFASSFTTVSPTAELKRLIDFDNTGLSEPSIDLRIFPAGSVLNDLQPKARKIEIIEGPLNLIDIIKDHKALFPTPFQTFLGNGNKDYLNKILTKLSIYGADTQAGFGWPEINLYLGSIELPYALQPLSLLNIEEQQHQDRFADQARLIKVPFILVTPKAEMPEGGWPLIIYQHGITGDRANALFPGIALASLCDRELDSQGQRQPNDCYATLAMDLPLHGVAPRWFEELTYKMLSVPGRLHLLEAKIASAVGSETGFAMTDCDASETQTFMALCRQYAAWRDVQERHFELYKDSDNKIQKMNWGFDDHEQSKGTAGTLFVNPGNLLSVRDRMQQSIADLLNLTASISHLNGQKEITLNTHKTHFIGHSLGSMLGSNYALLNQHYAAQNPEHPSLKGVALLTPGGGISRIIERSSKFREPLFSNFKKNDKIAHWMPGSAGWETFALGIQTLLDTVDPFTYAQQWTKLTGEKRIDRLYVAEIVGGVKHPRTSEVSKSDTVIPNSMHSPMKDECKQNGPCFGKSLPSYFAGTEPLIAQMQLKALYNKKLQDGMQLAIPASQTGVPDSRHWVARLNQGYHFTPISPFHGIKEVMDKDVHHLLEALSSSNRPFCGTQSGTVGRYERLLCEAMDVAGMNSSDNTTIHYQSLHPYLPLFEEFRHRLEEEIQPYLKLYASVLANFTDSAMTLDLGPYLSPVANNDLPINRYSVDNRLFKPLPLFHCKLNECVLNPNAAGGFYGIQSELVSLTQDEQITTKVTGTSCRRAPEKSKQQCERLSQYNRINGKRAKAKWRFQVQRPGDYTLSVRIPNKEVFEGSNCMEFTVLSKAGYSSTIRVSQVPKRTTVVCQQAHKVAKDRASTDIHLGNYRFDDPQQVYEVKVVNLHNADSPLAPKDPFYTPPMALGSLILKEVDEGEKNLSKRSTDDGKSETSDRATALNVGQATGLLTITSDDDRISFSGAWYERSAVDGEKKMVHYVDTLGGKIQFKLKVQEAGVYRIIFDKRLGDIKGVLDKKAAMRLSINGEKGTASGHNRTIRISKKGDKETLVVKLLKGEYQFTFEAHGNNTVNWGAYFGKMSIQFEKKIDLSRHEGWEPLLIASSELEDRIVWLSNLKQQGIEKPLVSKFKILTKDRYKLLINLPGDSSLGVCDSLNKEVCGYGRVSASLQKSDGTIIVKGVFDTYNSDVVGKSLFDQALEPGDYQLVIKASEQDAAFKDYHHLSFESLQVVRVIKEGVTTETGRKPVALQSGKQALLRKLTKEDINNPLVVHDFEVAEEDKYRLLINLPGNTSLGKCSWFGYETCGYPRVEVSLRNSEGGTVAEGAFDTYNNDIVSGLLYEGKLQQGTYTLVVKAVGKAADVEDYHHLSFESLEVVREVP